MYDAASRLTGQQYQDGTRATFAYDANTRRTVLSDWTGLYTSSYDRGGRLSSVVNPAGIVITYNYDTVGRRATMLQPTGTFTYVYDPAGRMSILTNPEGQTTTWSYDPASRVTQQLLANGVTVSNTYDKADRLLFLANVGPGATTLSSFAYTYNPMGNRTQVVEFDGSVVTWSYDPTHQLTNEQRSGTTAYNITYVYDGIGNRTLMVNNGTPTTYSYNVANELLTSQTGGGTTTYTFDGDGNLLTTAAPAGQLTTNTWDGENRLTAVSLPTVVDTFTYNADGQRVRQQGPIGTTNQIWDDQNVLLETSGSNIIQAVYSLEPRLYGNLISLLRGATDSFYLFDAHGSTRQLTRIAGSVSDTYIYDSFGNLLFQNGSTTNSFQYIGRLGYYFDLDTSLFYIRARYLSASAGLFLGLDPEYIVPDRLYCDNDPVNLQDASGRDAYPGPIVIELDWGALCGPVPPKTGPKPGTYCGWIQWACTGCCTTSQIASAKACCATEDMKLYNCKPNWYGPGAFIECIEDFDCVEHFVRCNEKWGDGGPGSIEVVGDPPRRRRRRSPHGWGQCGVCLSKCLIDEKWPDSPDCDYERFPRPPAPPWRRPGPFRPRR